MYQTENKHPVVIAINLMLDNLPDAEALDILGDVLIDREVPYVIWSHDDFMAEIKEGWKDEIPANLWHQIAAKSLEQARDVLSDHRNAEVMNDTIDAVWGDWQVTKEREAAERAERATWTDFKVRFRNPENRQEVHAHFVLAKNADHAHARIIESFPDLKGWIVASVREVR